MSIIRDANISKPGHQSKCGNLTVPYPFSVGLGLGCSIGTWFDINCNISFNLSKPFISTSNLKVVDISDEGIRIKNWVASNCNNQIGNWTNGNPIWSNLATTSYTFLDANKFIVVWCDD
jgi:hypothetical protein